MIKNYLIIAWRNLLRHKSFSLINILGLAAGITACVMIFLYVRYELTYDQHNENAPRIARVTTLLKAPGSDMDFGTSPYPLADALRRDFPEIVNTVRIDPVNAIVDHNNQLFDEDNVYDADQSIFSVFTFSFVEGAAANALQEPNAIVLTKTTARKYFGDQPALGKDMVINKKTFRVTGVIADPPANSDIAINALRSADFSRHKTWIEDFPVYTFVLFNQPVDLNAFTKKIKPYADKYCEPEFKKMGDIDYHVSFNFEALTDVHFSQGKLIDTPKGNRQFNYIFSILAAFILIIALLNYINLATARAAERAKEVGVRKVNGARPFQLMRQFLFESFLLISIAWAIAFIAVYCILPFFNTLLEVQLSIDWSKFLPFVLTAFGITLLLAGLYPAFVLSRFQPVQVLKGNWRHGGKGILLRKVLTTAQFVITAALITGTVVIYYQMKFIEHKDTGYVKDQVVTINISNDDVAQKAVPALLKDWQQQSIVKGVSAGSGIDERGLSLATTFAGTGANKKEFINNYFFIDQAFLPLLQVQLKAGRNISDTMGTDKKEAFLVNEAFVEKMGWTNPIGQALEGFGHKGKVVGVVKNFYYKSLHNLVEPVILLPNTNPILEVMVKVAPKDLPQLAATWKQHYSWLPFDYTFLDEAWKSQYDKDRLTMKLFTYFTVLAILISCLGLYGLVSLMAVQRTKEIGIRKVLGASLRSLLTLLTSDLLRLITIAAFIALPLAGIAMHQWLTNYAYHISLAWWMFLLPFVLILVIALLVVGRQVWVAALANPVKALRNES